MKKKLLFLITGLWVAQLLRAQEAHNANGSSFTQCVSFSISKPLKELAEMYPAFEKENAAEKEAADGESDRSADIEPNPNALPFGEDPVRQRIQGTRVLSAPLVNIDGVTSTFSPYDPSGAASDKYYVQTINETYRVYDKTGMPVTNPLALSTIWQTLGYNGRGDGIVMYDKFADRWVITELETASGNKVLIAVSATSDPAGQFYQYAFAPASTTLPDYPKTTIWSDGYYQTYNISPQRILVYERDKMLKGDNTAGVINTAFNASSLAPLPSGFAPPVLLNADGQIPPYGTPNYLMYFEDDNRNANVKDGIALYKTVTNWTNKTTTITLDKVLPAQPFNSVFTSGRSEIAQPGTTNGLDALEGFFYYRAQYTRWTGYNSVVICNDVNMGNLTAGIRWYELRQDTGTQVWSIYQQGTYALADNISRWDASIAMDNNGNIGLGYCVSDSKSVYPGIRYTGRLAGDSLGKMTFLEQVAVSGTSSRTSSQRWGDYSHLSLDPDGNTFWHTSMYCSGGGANKSRIYSFRLASATGIEENQNQSQFYSFQSEDNLHVIASRLPSNDKIVVDLFDIQGRQLSGKMISPVLNQFETTMNVSNLVKGIYLVRVGNNSFQKVIKVRVN